MITLKSNLLITFHDKRKNGNHKYYDGYMCFRVDL